MIIISTTPIQQGKIVGLTEDIRIQFNLAIDPTTIDQASITVTTKKANILTPSMTGTNEEIYKNDEFFNPEFTGIAEGTVSIDPLVPSVLVFHPSFRLMPNTDYVVYIANGIAGSDHSLLDTLYTLSFKTQENDISVPITVEEGSVILGTNFLPPEEQQGFAISSSRPSKNSFLNIGKTIKINFNQKINSPSPSDITVSIVGALDDGYGADTPFTLVSTDQSITLTLDDTPPGNSYVIVALTGIRSTSGNSLDEFELNYLTGLTPYYTSTKLIRLIAGSVLTTVSDEVLATTIYWTSLEADMKLRKLIGTPDAVYLRSHWVMNSAIEKLLLNNSQSIASDSIRKVLGEYSISINNGSKVKLYNQLLSSVKHFLKVFDSMLAFQNSGVVRKGSAHQSHSGRTWYFDVSMPALNRREYGTNKKVWDQPGALAQGIIWNTVGTAVGTGAERPYDIYLNNEL